MDAIPPSLCLPLRGRLGLDEDDDSRDADILAMSPVEMVREATAWKLGDPSWARIIARYMVVTGAKPEDF
jgi:hypothetical protein